MPGQPRPRSTVSSPAATPTNPATTASTGHAARTAVVTTAPGDPPTDDRAATSAPSRPVSGRSPDQTSTPPATAASRPTATRPAPRTATRATAAASRSSPVAVVSGAIWPPVTWSETGGSGGGRTAVTRAHTCPAADSASPPATAVPTTAATS